MYTPRIPTVADRTADRRTRPASSTWFLGRPGHMYAAHFPQRRRVGLDDQRTR
jgi:hypothetical protein